MFWCNSVRVGACSQLAARRRPDEQAVTAAKPACTTDGVVSLGVSSRACVQLRWRFDEAFGLSCMMSAPEPGFALEPRRTKRGLGATQLAIAITNLAVGRSSSSSRHAGDVNIINSFPFDFLGSLEQMLFIGHFLLVCPLEGGDMRSSRKPEHLRQGFKAAPFDAKPPACLRPYVRRDLWMLRACGCF